jgi:hypothetical protein
MKKFLLTKSAAREELGVTEDRLNDLIEIGLVETVTVGKRKMISRAAISKFVSLTTGK